MVPVSINNNCDPEKTYNPAAAWLSLPAEFTTCFTLWLTYSVFHKSERFRRVAIYPQSAIAFLPNAFHYAIIILDVDLMAAAIRSWYDYLPFVTLYTPVPTDFHLYMLPLNYRYRDYTGAGIFFWSGKLLTENRRHPVIVAVTLTILHWDRAGNLLVLICDHLAAYTSIWFQTCSYHSEANFTLFCLTNLHKSNWEISKLFQLGFLLPYQGFLWIIWAFFISSKLKYPQTSYKYLSGTNARTN